MQPGQTITPGGDEPQQNVAAEQTVSVPASIPELPAAESTPAFDGQAPEQPTPGMYAGEDAVTWTASEFIAHHKGGPWFVILGLATLVISATMYLLSKDILATVAIALAGVSFGVFAARQPRVLQYTVDDHGLTIGERTYGYGEIHSFALLEDGPLPSIIIMPMKRFLPPITLHFAPEETDKIADALAARLPHEDRQPDAVDMLMSKIRF